MHERDGRFNRLWAGQTASMFGTAISGVAIPTIAILTMRSPAYLVGVLQAAQFVAYPLLGVIVGVWLDRWPRRRAMLAADVVRGLALMTIPAADFVHRLSFGQLVAVAVIVSCASVFFDVGYQAFVPDLVEPSLLETANARLEASSSVARLAGSGVAGTLVALVGAPLSLALDTASYAVSAAMLGTIGADERHLRAMDNRSAGRFPDAAWEGLRIALGSPVLRALMGATATINFGYSVVSAVYVLFLYRTLHFSPMLVGVIFATSNIGFIGALIAPALRRRYSAASVLRTTLLASIAGTLIIPLAAQGWSVNVIFVGQLTLALSVPIYNITQVSLRQRLVAAHQLARTSATMKTAVWGVMPLGALLGGTLGTAIGPEATIWTGGGLMLAAVPWLCSSEFRWSAALGEAPPGRGQDWSR